MSIRLIRAEVPIAGLHARNATQALYPSLWKRFILGYSFFLGRQGFKVNLSPKHAVMGDFGDTLVAYDVQGGLYCVKLTSGSQRFTTWDDPGCVANLGFTDDKTIVSWTYTDGTSNDGAYPLWIRSTTGRGMYVRTRNNLGRFEWYHFGDTASAFHNNSPAPTTGKWEGVASTYRSSTSLSRNIRFAKGNAIDDSSSTATPSGYTFGSVRISHQVGTWLGQAMLWNRVLTDQEIKLVCTDPYAMWRLNSRYYVSSSVAGTRNPLIPGSTNLIVGKI